MPKVHVGTTALKNVKVQVYSQARYINRKILIDFSGLHSLPKFGPEPNSQSHCQYSHTELHSQPCSPNKNNAQEMALKNQKGKGRKQNVTDEQGKHVDTRNMPHGLHLLSCKGGKGLPKMRCLNEHLNIS